jgi:hypothetical protein
VIWEGSTSVTRERLCCFCGIFTSGNVHTSAVMQVEKSMVVSVL